MILKKIIEKMLLVSLLLVSALFKFQCLKKTLLITETHTHSYLLGLSLEGGRQHVGEELQSHWEQELHEGDDDEDQEGQQSEDVGTGSQELEETFRERRKLETPLKTDTEEGGRS